MCACVCACVLGANVDAAARLARILRIWHRGTSKQYTLHPRDTKEAAVAPFAHIVIVERFGLLIPLGHPLGLPCG